MALRLSIQREAWHRAVGVAAAQWPGIIPVVKGNGYGFGRTELMAIAADMAGEIAVGSVYEAGDVPADRIALVLTPHLARLPELATTTVLTIGSLEHLRALARQNWQGSVVVKLRSSMRRYGVDAATLDQLVASIIDQQWKIHAYGLHFGLHGDPNDHFREVQSWLPQLDPAIPLALSHLPAPLYRQLRREHPQHQFRYRSGTALWHADKSLLQLEADVIDVAAISAGTPAGYRGNPSPADGFVVMVGAGTAHGVHPLEDGRSPFHFRRRRLALLEAPHMHTSMVFVAADEDCPQPGELVDVQRPLTQSLIDVLCWLDD